MAGQGSRAKRKQRRRSQRQGETTNTANNIAGISEMSGTGEHSSKQITSAQPETPRQSSSHNSPQNKEQRYSAAPRFSIDLGRNFLPRGTRCIQIAENNPISCDQPVTARWRMISNQPGSSPGKWNEMQLPSGRLRHFPPARAGAYPGGPWDLSRPPDIQENQIFVESQSFGRRLHETAVELDVRGPGGQSRIRIQTEQAALSHQQLQAMLEQIGEQHGWDNQIEGLGRPTAPNSQHGSLQAAARRAWRQLPRRAASINALGGKELEQTTETMSENLREGRIRLQSDELMLNTGELHGLRAHRSDHTPARLAFIAQAHRARKEALIHHDYGRPRNRSFDARAATTLKRHPAGRNWINLLEEARQTRRLPARSATWRTYETWCSWITSQCLERLGYLRDRSWHWLEEGTHTRRLREQSWIDHIRPAQGQNHERPRAIRLHISPWFPGERAGSAPLRPDIALQLIELTPPHQQHWLILDAKMRNMTEAAANRLRHEITNKYTRAIQRSHPEVTPQCTILYLGNPGDPEKDMEVIPDGPIRLNPSDPHPVQHLLKAISNWLEHPEDPITQSDQT